MQPTTCCDGHEEEADINSGMVYVCTYVCMYVCMYVCSIYPIASYHMHIIYYYFFLSSTGQCLFAVHECSSIDESFASEAIETILPNQYPSY